MLNSLGLGFLFTATDLASGVMKNLQANFQGLENAAGRNVDGLDKMIQGLAAGLTGVAVGFGGLTTTFKLAQEAGSLEHALTRVAVVGGATADELAEMRKVALQLAPELGAMPNEAIYTLKLLKQKGYETKEALESIPGVMKFAAAGEMSVESAADLANQAMRAFGIARPYFTKAMDQMQAGANMFSFDPEDLQIGLARAASGASLFNATLTDTVAMYGLVKDVQGSVQVSGTAVSTMLQRMTDPKHQEAIKKTLGVDVVDSATGQFRDVLDVFEEMLPALDKMSEAASAAFIKKTFGSDGMKGFNSLQARIKSGVVDINGNLVKGYGAIRAAVDKLSHQHGVLDAASERALADHEGKMAKLSAHADAFVKRLGEPFKELWDPWIERATDILRDMGAVIDKMNPAVLRFGAGVIMTASALFTLGGAAVVWNKASGLISAGFGLITDALRGLGKSAMTTAIRFWPVMLALIAFGAIAYAVHENFGGLGDAWDRLSEKFGEGNGLSSFFGNVGTLLEHFVDAFVTGLGEMQLVWDVVAAAFDSLGEQLGELAADFGFVEKGPGKNLKAFFRMLGTGIAWVVGIVAGLGGVFIWLGSKLLWVYRKVFLPVFKFIFEWVGKLMKGIGSVMRALGMEVPKSLDGKHKMKIDVERKTLGDSEVPKETKGVDIDTTGIKVSKEARTKKGSVPSPLASADETNFLEGMLPGKHREAIDYNKLAAAMGNVQFAVHLDGRRIASSVERIQNAESARRSDLG